MNRVEEPRLWRLKGDLLRLEVVAKHNPHQRVVFRNHVFEELNGQLMPTSKSPLEVLKSQTHDQNQP